MQQSSNEAVEVNGVIHIDVRPQNLPDSRLLPACSRQAEEGQQAAQALQVRGHGDISPAEQARRIGNLVGGVPQRIIIGGENPSALSKNCVPWSA